MYARKWQKVLKVSTNHPIQKNIKETLQTSYVEVVGKDASVITVIIIQVSYLGHLKNFLFLICLQWMVEFIDTFQIT
jgi:hypothetical protein